MKQFLFLSLLLCFTAFASGSSSYSHDFEELYEICSDDQFEYNGWQVNSFRLVHVNLTLPLAGKFALDETVDYYQLFNETEADELDWIRMNYHHLLIELYGSRYLNNPVNDLMHQKFASLQTNLTRFLGKSNNPSVADRILIFQSKQIEEAKNLLKILNTHKKEVLVPEIMNQGHFDFHLILLKAYDENSTNAFLKDKSSDIYQKRIYQFERFVPKRASRMFHEWRKDSGELLSNVYFPFEQRNSKFVDAARPCVTAKELPLFFQLKGKDVSWLFSKDSL